MSRLEWIETAAWFGALLATGVTIVLYKTMGMLIKLMEYLEEKERITNKEKQDG